MLHEQSAREANIQRARSMIAAAPGHDLYVLPELASSGYGREAFTQLDRLAEDLDGPSFRAFSALAQRQDCWICYSFPRRTAGRPTICAAVVDRHGQLAAVYDKWHVCGTGDCPEKRFFDAGQSPPAVFTIEAVRVGLCICYDIRFPELARKLALEEGVALLIHPGGWPRGEGLETWRPFVISRAIENGIYIMSPNRAGARNGGTVFCPPDVDLVGRHPQTLADENAEGVLVGHVDLDRLEAHRRSSGLLADRRPDLY